MSLKSFSVWSTAACAFLAGAAGQPLDVRHAEIPSSFGLFVYGPKESGLGGLPVISKDGLAYAVTNTSDSTGAPAQDLSFSLENSGRLVASPSNNSTATNATTFLYVPSGPGSVGFASASNTSQVAQKFGLYGGMLYFHPASGSSSGIQTLWYAVASAEEDEQQTWGVKWNLTSAELEAAGDRAVPVAVRITGPASQALAE